MFAVSNVIALTFKCKVYPQLLFINFFPKTQVQYRSSAWLLRSCNTKFNKRNTVLCYQRKVADQILCFLLANNIKDWQQSDYLVRNFASFLISSFISENETYFPNTNHRWPLLFPSLIANNISQCTNAGCIEKSAKSK